MELILVDKNNYKLAIDIQHSIFPHEDGTLNILASLDRDLFIRTTGLYYIDDGVKYYLAKENGEFVGITGLYHYDSDSAWIAWFGILDKYRYKGLGRKLLRKTMDKALSLGYKYIRLYTDSVSNREAICLYEKEGFVGERYTVEKLNYDCWIYSKSLIDDNVVLWNNKLLDLGYQSELDQMNDKKIKEIVKMYDNIFLEGN